MLQKQVPVETELGGVEPKACANGDSNENLKIGFHENEYGEDDDSSRDNDDDLYYGWYGTGYYNNSEDFDAVKFIKKISFCYFSSESCKMPRNNRVEGLSNWISFFVSLGFEMQQ